MNNRNKIKILAIFLIFGCIFLMPSALRATQTDVEKLNGDIETKKKDIDDIKKRIEVYQKNIQAKQEEAASLKNQLSILDNQKAKTELDIKATGLEISKTQLETRGVELKIVAKEDEIAGKRENLSGILQEIHKNDSENTLKIFLLNDSFSEFFNAVEYTKDLQVNLQDSLENVKADKAELDQEKAQLEAKQEKLAELQADLDNQKKELDGENKYKTDLLAQTRESEAKFSELYWQAKQEQQSISSDISNLEKQVRAKLKQMEESKQMKLGSSDLVWPLASHRVTSTFHDKTYPFRYLFEHPAIDIGTGQGTSIKAPADGYVLKAIDNGMGYSYIALIHADGMSTVYGHVSKIYVDDDEFVSRGDVIGLTGGMPGTPGAGRLSTGPHLHFEVRLNGIPVNPLNYLP
jgi:murein DD-endopeptidase MepM/ murein hydrolase activator NlpD